MTEMVHVKEIQGVKRIISNNESSPRTIGAVDLGTLNWAYSSASAYFSASLPSMASHGTTTKGNLFASGYSVATFISMYNHPEGDDLVMAQSNGSNHYIYIRNKAYTVASDFKAAVSGLYLYYELATPVPAETVEFNQLVDHTGNTKTERGVTFTNNGNGSWTVTGTPQGQSALVNVGSNFSVLAGHKYLVSGDKYVETKGDPYLAISTGTPITGRIGDYIYNKAGIVTATEDANNVKFFIYNRIAATGTYNLTLWPQVFDLTQMFGAGHEPETAEEFQKLFPLNYYPQNEGETKPLPVILWEEQE